MKIKPFCEMLRTPVRLLRSYGWMKTKDVILNTTACLGHPAMGNNVSGISALQRSQQQGFHRLRNSQKGQ
ncbi:hypothetical protein GOODEAATRI_027011 [Goodea atripinnis]|uniref:Uncharacterized protein n=1 Tax=Goodea atripinnis TaxID=208336 RepID=A0ABV0NDW6_9TELE